MTENWYGPRTEESLVKLTQQNDSLSKQLDGIESAILTGSVLIGLGLFLHAVAYYLWRRK